MMPKNGIDLDDWKKSVTILPIAAEKAFSDFGNTVKDNFFIAPVIPYKPLYYDSEEKKVKLDI